MRNGRLLPLVALALAVSGCASVRQVLGIPGADPTVELKSAEPRWVLIKNPRFGDVPSEPEYVWVEEDKVPFSFRGIFNRDALLAPPEIVAKYGPPPGGGRISPRQGVPVQAAPAGAGTPAAVQKPAGATQAGPAAPEPKLGIVVYVDTTRIVVDLTAADGLRPGTVLSLRRDKIPIVHPITGEVLGELDEEIGTARVTEVRDRFSVAEVQSVAPGQHIQLRDRAVPK